NYYMQFLEEQLNIKIEYLWAVPSSQYQEKFGVSLASGDLPDIIKGLNPVQFEMLRSNDMLADISTGFDYLVPSLEEYWMRSPETFAIYNFDGQQLGVPQYWDQKRDAMIMYVRQDWLDKLGLAVPTTVEELRNVAVAFAEMDPDGNGVKDTYGLALNNMGANKAKTPKSVAAALQMFGGYADAWLDDGQGGLMNGTIQPAIKDGLTYLHELYTLGAIDPEFVVKDDDKVSEDIISGKAGIFFSVFWEMSTTAYNTVANNHDARWAVARLPGVGGTANVSLDEVAITGIIAVNKTCPSMEAFIKLMNYAHIWEDFTWENTDGTITTRFKEAPDFQKFKTGWAWQWMPVNCIL
ncbi:MAG: extracellular solute-binding protein, partial [Clostridia bacterium]